VAANHKWLASGSTDETIKFVLFFFFSVPLSKSAFDSFFSVYNLKKRVEYGTLQHHAGAITGELSAVDAFPLSADVACGARLFSSG
jgi:hypothetical protein